MKKIAILAFAAAILAGGCTSESPSLGAGSSYIGTLVFNHDLTNYVAKAEATLDRKAAFVRSRSLWDSRTNVLLMSGPVQNNFWTFDAVTNVNLTVMGREAELVGLYETNYGTLDAPEEEPEE